MLRWLLKFILTKLYKIEVIGLQNYRKAEKRAVVVANHLSLLDGMLIALFLPKEPLFVINTAVANRWYVKPLKFFIDIFPLDSTNSISTKSIIKELRKNKQCLIFPEGRITLMGSMMKVYEGPAMVADRAEASILPILIEGAQYTPFSYLRNKIRIRWFPKITLTILEPQSFKAPKGIMGRERRRIGGLKLYNIMSDMMFNSSNHNKTLLQSLIEQTLIHGRHHVILEDVLRAPLNYGQLLTRIFILGKKISELVEEECVGLLLPNMTSTIITFFGLHAYKYLPAMLNFSLGLQNLMSTTTTAGIKTVITSRQFVERGNFTETIEALEQNNITVLYLEDIAKTITLLDKVVGLFQSLTAHHHKVGEKDPDAPAVILFTSGSEGKPKGVVLSHANLQSNRLQLGARVDFGPKDIVFNSLPIFHSFGFTAGMLLPLLAGMKAFCYPSPLHYRIIPELVYEIDATIMFGTDTFLSGYARFAQPYNFYSIRYIFAGAEKLREETRRLWTDKYGTRILECYGATETSPGISTNTAMHNKVGTVGKLLPGIQYKIKKVPGIADGGRLIISGPNVMKGYILNENPKVLVPLKTAYDTGDIVSIDNEGYISILGRAKRFAKIAGEMVSLISIETYLYELWPDWRHAVLAIPDSKRGETIILVTTNPDAKREDIQTYVQAQGIGELLLPRYIKIVKELPLLGAGKTDYVSLQVIANEEELLS